MAVEILRKYLPIFIYDLILSERDFVVMNQTSFRTVLFFNANFINCFENYLFVSIFKHFHLTGR